MVSLLGQVSAERYGVPRRRASAATPGSAARWYDGWMREEDRSRFEEERDYQDGEAAARHLEEVLGLDLKTVRELADELRGDLDPTRLGIGWWSPYPDDKRRILISDYLVQSANGIVINQQNAAIHFLEYRGAFEQIEKRVAHATSASGTFQYPKPTRPSDLLPERLLDAHMAGFFRALGSTLDCLSAVAVGVLGVPTKIIMSDFAKLRRWFHDASQARQPPHRKQIEFGLQLETIIGRAGPPGWAEWVDAFRNMLVHRARRLVLNVFDEEAHILDARGIPVRSLVATPVLPRDPAQSEIQAMVNDALPVLREDGRKTAWGAFRSIRYLVDDACKALLEVWRERRSNPPLLQQPKAEWPEVLPPRPNPFNGYEDKKLEINVKALMTDPSAPARLQAAAITSDRRPLWDAGLTG
jgi:hypothetical protein